MPNLINRHGEEKGLEIWQSYCDKQRYSTSLEYFINKYGDEKGTEVYNNFALKRSFSSKYSLSSQNLFESLRNHLTQYTLYYATYNKEYFLYDKDNSKYYLLDFYIKELKISIEFNGDVWHANPSFYKEDDIPIEKIGKVAKDIWEYDKKKCEFVKTKVNKLIIIWESDFNKMGIEGSTEYLINKINEFKNENGLQ